MAPRRQTQLDWTRVALLVACLVAGTFLWDYPVVLPLKWVVVAMHETGHALATLVMGGSVERVSLAANESGSCLSQMPDGVLRQVVVSSAGYVGSALAGAILLLATFRLRLRRAVTWGMCLWLGLLGVLSARDTFTLTFCLGAALVMALAARFLPDAALDALNLFLAAFSVLYVVRDLRDDLWNGDVRVHSDAGILAGITHVPSLVWAGLWTAASLAILFLFARAALRKTAPQYPAMPVTLPNGRL